MRTNVKINGMTFTEDQVEIVATISRLDELNVSMYELKNMIADQVAKKIAEQWFLEHGQEVMEKINANQILNAVILRLGNRVAGS